MAIFQELKVFKNNTLKSHTNLELKTQHADNLISFNTMSMFTYSQLASNKYSALQENLYGSISYNLYRTIQALLVSLKGNNAELDRKQFTTFDNNQKLYIKTANGWKQGKLYIKDESWIPYSVVFEKMYSTFDFMMEDGYVDSIQQAGNMGVYTLTLPIGYANTSPKLNEDGSNFILTYKTPSSTNFIALGNIVILSVEAESITVSFLAPNPSVTSTWNMKAIIDTPMST